MQSRLKFAQYLIWKLQYVLNWHLKGPKPDGTFAVCQSLLKIGMIVFALSKVFETKKHLLEVPSDATELGACNFILA